MGTGYLQVRATTAEEAIPIAGAKVVVSQSGKTLYTVFTDNNGNTEPVQLNAPDREVLLNQDYKFLPYAKYDVTVSSDGLATKVFHGIMVYSDDTTILPVNMTPDLATDYIDNPELNGNIINHGGYQEIFLPNYELILPPAERYVEFADFDNVNPLTLPDVVIPYEVRVHLGRPESNATNVHIPFREYVWNVASHEVEWHWTDSTLEANIYCIISLVLNRIYTEWYPSRGKNFDITSETYNDQKFVYQGEYSVRIRTMVEQIFNRFIRRGGHKEPFFAEYCNGTTATCPGLSQTGSQALGLQGYTPIQILRYYYPPDVSIHETNNMQHIQASYPGYPLSMGVSGESVRVMQNYLNRIRVNYTWQIPQINPVDGVFGTQTYNAVRGVQEIYVSSQPSTPVTGIVDFTTWYRIVYLYTAIRKLGELISEGQIIGVDRTPPTTTLGQGSTQRREIGILQFLLNFISDFYPEVPSVIPDNNFGAETVNAVRAFQMAFNLTSDGTVGRNTWNKLFEVYWNLNDDIILPPPPPPPPPPIPPFPGTNQQVGSSGAAVSQIQNCLNNIANRYPTIPKLTVDGQFGNNTRNAVIVFQRIFGLAQDGIVGPVTWNRIMTECANSGPSTIPPFPGTNLQVGSRGAAVTQIQNCLNNLSSRYPSIPKLAADGNFGNITRSAVIAFQQIFGLTPDGVVGPLTWNRIMTECANVGTTPPVIPPFPGTSLRVGSSGAAVQQVQNCLNNIRNRFPSIPALIVDGRFGNNTHNAVVAFQRIFELTPDGIVGPITWNRIMTECNASGASLASGRFLDGTHTGSLFESLPSTAGCFSMMIGSTPNMNMFATDLLKLMLLLRFFGLYQ